MRTQLMAERTVGLPWLEHIPPEGGPPEQTPIPSFPFTLGRNESADLPIRSNRVSREHAVILHEGDGYRVRDLGSTNGTFVNGRRIDESPLSDGDLLLVADVEFTFFVGRGGGVDRNVTQVIDLRPARGPRGDGATEMLREVRRLQEMLVTGAIDLQFRPIVSLDDGGCVGHEARSEADAGEPDASEARRLAMKTESRWPCRLRRLARMVAAEQAATFPQPGKLFLAIDACEIGMPGLADSLAALRDLLPGERRLVVEAPDAAVADTPYFRALCERLRAVGLEVAHHGFGAGPAQLAQRVAIAPDYLVLSPAMVRGIDRNLERRRQVQAIARAASALGCEVIAAGLHRDEEAAACRDAGCGLGQFDAGASP